VWNLSPKNLSYHIVRDLLGGKPYSFENFVSGSMLQKLVWQTNFVQSRINLRCSHVLADTGADATDLYTVFDSNHEPVFGCLIENGLGNRNDPARVNYRSPDTLRPE
jgi:hypothetical protein